MPHSPSSFDRPASVDGWPEQRPVDLTLRYTADIVTAYLQRNPLSTDGLLLTLRAIYVAVAGLDPQTRPQVEKPPTPAVDPANSVHPDYLVCLEDGVRLKMLKRHLREAFHLTPEAYRQRWGLPPDYPMMAPNHAAQRSRAARERARRAPPGFMAGRRAAAAELPPLPPEPVPAADDAVDGARRGRPPGRRPVPSRRTE